MTRRLKKIRIRIDDEAHLQSMADTSLSRLGLAGVVIAVFILAVVVAGTVIMLTPLRTLLPGYMKEDQRSATIETLLRLDSLKAAYETNDRFLRNYLQVTDINRIPSDSASLAADSLSLSSDSLLPPSRSERNFVDMMEEREKFNISVLAPLAADGMMFSSVSDAAVFSSSSKESTDAEILLAGDNPVQAIADGCVLAVFHSPAEHGYVVVVQHSRGFASRYAGLGIPIVALGDIVSAGQILASAPSPDRFGKRSLHLRLWHNTLPVVPYKYIGSPSFSSDNEVFSDENLFEAPRGK